MKDISININKFWLKVIILSIWLLLIISFVKNKTRSNQLITEEAAMTENQELLAKEKEVNYPGQYQILEGDSLSKIAKDFYNDANLWTEIARLNKIENPNVVEVGMILEMPEIKPKGEILDGVSIEAILGESYEVAAGDCLWIIAERAYGDPYRWTELALINNLDNPDLILVGQKLKIKR